MALAYHLRSYQQPDRSHQESFLHAINTINHGVKRSVASSRQYTKAAVLSLRWSNDDLSLKPLETALLQVLETRFGFKTSSFVIPTNSTYDTRVQTRDALESFVSKYDSENSLLVVFYGGHGGLEQNAFEIL
jgi:hypothetical protein